jgi:putative membrane protein
MVEMILCHDRLPRATQSLLVGLIQQAFRFGLCTGSCGTGPIHTDLARRKKVSHMYWYGLSSLVFWVLAMMLAAGLMGSFARGGRRNLPSPRYGTLVPHDQPGSPSGHGLVAAEQIVAERFARGEIDEDEFWQRITTLRAGRPGDTSTATTS